jgi:hypothetical protein
MSRRSRHQILDSFGADNANFVHLTLSPKESCPVLQFVEASIKPRCSSYLFSLEVIPLCKAAWGPQPPVSGPRFQVHLARPLRREGRSS